MEKTQEIVPLADGTLVATPDIPSEDSCGICKETSLTTTIASGLDLVQQVDAPERQKGPKTSFFDAPSFRRQIGDQLFFCRIGTLRLKP
jgi:hypothetical protein